MNRAVNPGAVWFESGRHSQLVHLFILLRCSLGGRDISDRLGEPSFVEHVHLFEGGELHRFNIAPWPGRIICALNWPLIVAARALP
ncbi:MAG: hypothetical protein B7Z58_14640 [Acidiphilium sp. 37-64-53]|nr:MAG: hypothetical protein B7Z58_14640 [Acidiphilium sp. 37-64-53]OZB23248.1 MAG: hypothetical protein B7X49_16295 [Acidiphilium sp. 34-64-41]